MSHDEISRAVILVIPHWLPFAFSIFVFVFAMASAVFNGLARRGFSKLAQMCAEAADGYVRSDEALAPVLEALGQPDGAESARERVVQHREMAQLLRDRNRRRGWRGLFRASPAVTGPRTPPGEGERTPEAVSGDLRAIPEPADPRR